MATAMTGGQDAVAKKCEELALNAQCIPGLAEEARGLRAIMVELEVASRMKTSNLWSKRRTAEMNADAEKALTERAEHSALIA